MSSPADQLVESLDAVLAALEQRDAEGAAALMDETAARFAATPSPADDPRVIERFTRCRALAEALHRSLGAELAQSATFDRAAAAYGVAP